MLGNRIDIRVVRKTVLAAATTLLSTHGALAGTIWSTNGHEYAFVPAAAVTWTDARAAAVGLGPGWDLATLTSADEEAFVRALLPAAPPDRSHVWLGGTDAAVEGDWQWVTGETWSYTNWWPGEPNDNGGVEEYLALDVRSGVWRWNDVSNDIDGRGWARGYVVERAAVPLPATLPLVVLGSTWVGWTRRRRSEGAT